jgi:hypothetical protein
MSCCSLSINRACLTFRFGFGQVVLAAFISFATSVILLGKYRDTTVQFKDMGRMRFHSQFFRGGESGDGVGEFFNAFDLSGD